MHLKISYSFLLPPLVLMVISCKRTPHTQTSLYQKEIDSIEYYLEKAKDKSLDAEQRKKYAWKAYEFTPVLNDSLKAKYYINTSLIFYKIGDFEDFKNLNHKSLTTASKIHNKRLMANSQHNLGLYYLNNKYIKDSAYYYFIEAKKIYEELNNPYRIGNILLNISIIERRNNNLTKAQIRLKESTYYFKLFNDFKSLSNTYNNLGNISRQIGNYEHALKNHLLALDYRTLLKNKYLISQSYNNIGVVYKEQKKYSKALSFYKKALSIDSIFYLKPSFYAKVINNLAYTKLKVKDENQLPNLFFKSLKIRDSLKDFPGILNSKLKLAEYYEYKNDTSQAKKYAYEAKQLAEKLKLDNDLLESLLILSRLEKGEKALEFTHRYIQIQDSLKNNEINTAKNQFDKIDLEIEELTQIKNEISSHKKILIISIIVLTLAFTSLYLFKQKQNQQRFNLLLNPLKTKSTNIKKTENTHKVTDLDEHIVNHITKSLKQFESGNNFLEKSITLNSLAKQLNTNSSYLSKIINSNKQKNFSTYINDLKIDYVIKKLQENTKFRNYTVSAIAEEAGFNNAQSFSKAFYKKTGIYPSYFITQLEKSDKHN
ncbi:tetratricopeptide repeat protein [Abyssalbus ytuae]|uniref:Tetratricopeptide repeat protein n=1 Tax=Abyssalbus ytuae TaxID=2926907 RepID=A0A9E7CTX1_9FLAO|nr:tetratricopeptide repeat protein [Abyssalbus ytuae]UOB18881.1 tetratricopeptide repeat protein [Abyssalbus ytuae]